MMTNELKRRKFLQLVGLSVGAAAMPLATTSCAPSTKRPNVILILTDDQGYGDLACLGNPVIETPVMDKLHTESVRLTNFHVGPTCAPTRASLMTGRYCNRTGVWHTVMGRSLLRKDEITIADVFKSGGYKTAIFGKWHLGDNYPFRPFDRGFDEALVHGGGGVSQTPDYWNNDYFDDTYFHNGEPKKFDGYCTDVWFDNAITFIEQNRNKPFFCYMPTNAPHGPYNVAEKYSKPYLEKGLPPARARFYGMITNINENIARLEKRLEELNLRDNTILIFMTDNGTAIGVNTDKQQFVTDGYNAGMRGRKGSEYDGGHRTPCFIRWPNGGIGGGKDIDHVTAHVDILPTLMDLCGIEKAPDHKLDGTSLAPLLANPDAAWPDRILVTDSQRVDEPIKWRKSAVMTDQWRLINGKELYDMKTDPGQKKDVAAEHPDVVAKLRNAYEKWWADVSERFKEYCYIIAGTEHENPTRLTAHDWHYEPMPWNQGYIRKGMISNGFWAVEFAQAGEYEIALRRWPRELDKKINEDIPAKTCIPGVTDLPAGKAFHIQRCKLNIGDQEWEAPVTDDDEEVVFNVNLPKAQTKLQTWFYDRSGEEFGAYYVYITKT